MATVPPPSQPRSLRSEKLLGKARTTILLALLAVLTLCMVFAWITRDAMAHLPFLQNGNKASIPEARNTLVGQSPWLTAQALAPLAVSSEETSLAREAERLADHEVDQAFAFALRQASVQRRSLTGDALALSQKVRQLEQTVKDDQDQIKRLTPNGPAASGAKGANEPPGGDDLEIVKAQLSLDSDVLADAQQQLAAASGDQRGRIQQELAAHEAVMAKYDAKAHSDAELAIVSVQHHSTLAGRIGAWLAQNSRGRLIQQALDQARASETSLSRDYDRLRTQAAAGESAPAQPQPTDRAARLAVLQQRSDERQLLTITSDRIQTEKQLAVVYGRWLTQLELQHRIVLHLILQSAALVVFILICALLGNVLVRRLTERPELDQRRMHTLRTILELSVQLVGVALILIVLFGVPTQLQTILGLTTAGLTVALQDFILAFFGWFVLMGKNGIRIGDAVEINGVAGQVTEVGLFRTTLLETGNSADTGHPTGRRVTFLNKYAINGQYFNFSTSEQWMWDELSVSVPASDGAFATIDEIHKLVEQQTGNDAKLAEEEWKRISKSHGLSQFSAEAQVNLRPASGGINVLVRYVTRAAYRFEARNRLYQSILDLMQTRDREAAAGEPAQTVSTAS